MMVRLFKENDESAGFRLFYPQEESAVYSEFSCRFETFGLSDNITGKALGIDAVSALVNAMMRLDIFLKASAEFKEGRLRWYAGDTPDDFGLPWGGAIQASDKDEENQP